MQENQPDDYPVADTTTTPSPCPPAWEACSHANFQVSANVETNGIAYYATIQFRCQHCGLPMRFPAADWHTALRVEMRP